LRQLDACLVGSEKPRTAVVAGRLWIFQKTGGSGSGKTVKKQCDGLARQQRPIIPLLTGLWAGILSICSVFRCIRSSGLLRPGGRGNGLSTRGRIHLRQLREVIYPVLKPRSTTITRPPGRSNPTGTSGYTGNPNRLKMQPKKTRQPAVYWRCWRPAIALFLTVFAAARTAGFEDIQALPATTAVVFLDRTKHASSWRKIAFAGNRIQKAKDLLCLAVSAPAPTVFNASRTTAQPQRHRLIVPGT